MRRAAARFVAFASAAPQHGWAQTRPIAAGASPIHADAAPRAALVRGLSPSFADSLKQHAPGQPIDWELAARQHAAYTQLLRRLVPRVVEVPADAHHPDCCFIEDAAIAAPGGVAVVTRPGAPERRGEVGPVAAALQGLAAESSGGGPPLIRAVHHIEAPALLDGGDVLQIAGHLLVGLSARTNAAAVDQLRAALQQRAPGGGGGGGAAAGGGLRVEALTVAHGLHLKSACSALDESTLLVSDDAAGRAVFDAISSRLPALAARLAIVTLPGDPVAANVLRAGRAVVVQGGCPDAEAVLRALCAARGLELHVLPRMTEFIKADGALTCCSVLVPP